MNKYLKGALYIVGTIVVFIILLFLICDGLLDTALEIGKDLGGK